MGEAGRPTDMTPELIDKIKRSILEGNDLKTTASVIGKSEDVMYQWHSKNYSGIADKIEGWKRDRKLMLANNNIEEILGMDKSDKDKLKVISDMSKFVAETLGKDIYSKRSELTGANGKELTPLMVKFIGDDKDNGNTNGIPPTV